MGSTDEDFSGMSSTVYWVILGTVLGVTAIGIAILYVICRYRSPGMCWSSDPLEEMLQETETITRSEFRTVRSGNKADMRPSTLVFKRESLKTVLTSSRSPRTLCVGCGDNFRYQNCSSKSDHVTNLWTTGKDKNDSMTDVAI